VPLLPKVDSNKLWHNVQNEVTLICAKFGTDLFNISKVISRETKWPRFLAYPVGAAVDSHRQLSTKMADILRDWLTDQNTDCCFVMIGLVRDIPQSFALHLKIDPTGPPSLLASSDGQRKTTQNCHLIGSVNQELD